MTGVKGRSGRPRKYPDNPDDTLREKVRKYQLAAYYRNREKVLERMKRYHKQIKDYADAHNISFEEARKAVGEQQKKEVKKSDVVSRV